jgi:hypothetical protein
MIEKTLPFAAVVNSLIDLAELGTLWVVVSIRR